MYSSFISLLAIAKPFKWKGHQTAAGEGDYSRGSAECCCKLTHLNVALPTVFLTELVNFETDLNHPFIYLGSIKLTPKDTRPVKRNGKTE